jgi:phytoene dehydrogenase-like protein
MTAASLYRPLPGARHSTGCHGGPGITFIPGYNAAQAVLADR